MKGDAGRGWKGSTRGTNGRKNWTEAGGRENRRNDKQEARLAEKRVEETRSEFCKDQVVQYELMWKGAVWQKGNQGRTSQDGNAAYEACLVSFSISTTTTTFCVGTYFPRRCRRKHGCGFAAPSHRQCRAAATRILRSAQPASSATTSCSFFE